MSEDRRPDLDQETAGLPVPTGEAPPVSPVSLQDVIKAAEPLVNRWLENQDRMQRRAIEAEGRAEKASGNRLRMVLTVLTVLSLSMIGLAVLLILRDKEETASTLITLLVSMAGAAFGGWGLGRSGASPKPSDEE